MAGSSQRSFRDPDAYLSLERERVLRFVRPQAAASFASLLEHPAVRRLMVDGRLVQTARAPAEDVPATDSPNASCYEHERIPFVGYPMEWSPAMLAVAAEFTLTLALDLLEHDFVLKDATPANVLFRATAPVFVDIPSIVRRPTGMFLWQAQDQFERCFVLPLIAHLETGVPISWCLRDSQRGLSHEQVARLLGARRWLKPSLLWSVALPASLNRAAQGRSGRSSTTMTNDERARFTLERTFRRNLRRVRSVAQSLKRERSMWRDYTATRAHYASDDVAGKTAFVRQVLATAKPAAVLDVGANTGEFSGLAAAAGAEVVAIDTDEAAVNQIFATAEEIRANVLPLVGDFTNPTPGYGWNNAETVPFLSRAEGRFDLILMLAVIHHMRVTAGIPIGRILELAARVTRERLLIEHVPVEDPMFQRLSRGRDDLYADCHRSTFETLLNQHFIVEQTQMLANGRKLIVARKR